MGTLRAGSELLADIQVTMHQVDGGSLRRVGFGVTDRNGSFELVTNGAQGPLWLSPGEYCCTLESAGRTREDSKRVCPGRDDSPQDFMVSRKQRTGPRYSDCLPREVTQSASIATQIAGDDESYPTRY